MFARMPCCDLDHVQRNQNVGTNVSSIDV